MAMVPGGSARLDSACSSELPPIMSRLQQSWAASMERTTLRIGATVAAAAAAAADDDGDDHENSIPRHGEGGAEEEGEGGETKEEDAYGV
jgi:hypothetical protein